MTISQFTSWHPWWGPFTVVLTAAAIWLTARGVKLSTVAVGAAVVLQVAIMLAVCFLVLVDQRAVLSGIPFSWAHLTGGLAGLSAGFPLALFMFIGWENGPALAEESRDPRRTIPRALYLSVAIAAALLVFFAYATITGFLHRPLIGPVPDDVRSLSRRGGRPGMDRRHRLRAGHPDRRS